jgi:hypothetical protein
MTRLNVSDGDFFLRLAISGLGLLPSVFRPPFLALRVLSVQQLKR